MEKTEIIQQNGKAEVVITPDTMIMSAIEKGLDINQLEKFLDLKERYEKREAEKAYYQAMNDFQANKPDLVKKSAVDYTTKTGQRVNYKFNPLPQIQKAIDPVLSKAGLSYNWKQSGENGKIRITCVVSHVQGFFKETWLEADSDNSGGKNSIQAIGSTVTYLKRYTLENALGLSSDEDNDGKDAPKKQEVVNSELKDQLVDLYMDKEEKLNESQKKNLDRILKNEETASYSKAIQHLKKL